MPNQQIIPPDQFDIEEELTRIIQFGDRKPIATWGKIQYDDFCRSLRTDNPAKPAIFEALCVLYGARMHDREKARQIFQILHRFALEWGIVGERPADTLRLFIERLCIIEEKDIEAMSQTELYEFQALAGDLSNEASKIHGLAIAVRHRQEGHGRPIELNGGGIKRA